MYKNILINMSFICNLQNITFVFKKNVNKKKFKKIKMIFKKLKK